MIISNVIIQGGSASFAGGILNFGSLTLAGVTSVRRNHALSGGGIGNADILTMNGSSEVTDNDASTGGGIFNSFQSIFPLPSAGLVTMNDSSRVSDNEADDGGDSAGATPGQLRTALVDVCSGGTIRLRPGLVVLLAQGELIIPSGKVVTIISPRLQPATIDAQGVSRVLSVENTAQLIMKSVIVQGGSAPSAGGILNLGSLTLAGVTSITGNHASRRRNRERWWRRDYERQQ